ncbi:MAG TPA: ABC transporter ATP-binding protein [Erysipelothrix sp.]|nr:ABC transporter ATP-binding protein [Erysipelothrix sp.]
MKILGKYLKKEAWLALLGIGFVAVVALMELYQIQLMAKIIDVGIAQQDFEIVKSVGLQMVILAILGAIVAMMGLYFPSQVSNNFALRLREDVFAKIQTFSLKNMSSFQTASLVTRLTNDINFLQRMVMMMLRMAVRAPVFLVATVVLTYFISPILASVLFFSVVFLSITLGLVIRQGFPRFIKLQKKVDKMNQTVQESLSNIRVIKSFVREPFEDEAFVTENHELYDASVSANILMVYMSPALMTAINFATAIVVYIASILIVDMKTLNIGELVVVISYLRFTMFSMMMLSHVLMMFSRSKASFERVAEVLNTNVDIETSSDARPLEDSQGLIEYKNVSFTYFDDMESILSNINFKVEPGKHIGIIGSTGAGKTTLINLLVRLIDVTDGEILFDGQNIKDIDLKYLRSQFGFVPQKNVLFTGTIEENLKLGNENASMELLERATKAASINAFIHEDKLGYQALIQQGGTNLSGGQRQRMCIARALITEPKVLVLDDSTSALDAATEKQVKESLAELYSDISIISIAQKISSVADSDTIIVMDQGQIVGLGQHLDLLETSSVYKEIYDSQMRKGELE